MNKFLFQLALLNIFRHRRRTFLTALAVFCGIFFAIFGDGMNRGLRHQLAVTGVSTDTSHLVIYAAGYYDPDGFNDLIDYPLPANNSELVAGIKSLPAVAALSRQIVFSASLTDSRLELPVTVIGIDPKAEDQVFDRSARLVAGEFLSGSAGAVGAAGQLPQLVLGKALAANFEVGLGDFLTILVRRADRSLDAADFEIVGLVDTGNPVIDGGTIWLEFDLARNFSGLPGPTRLAVRSVFEAMNLEKQAELKQQIVKLTERSGVEVYAWYDIMADLMLMLDVRERVMALVTFIILIMAAAVIANTMLMAMLERRHEIGVLMSCGLNRTGILKLFFGEGMIIGIFGGIAAVGLGALTVMYFQSHGLLIAMDDAAYLDQFPLDSRLYFYLKPAILLDYFLLGLAVTAVASLYPAFMAARLQPVEALGSGN